MPFNARDVGNKLVTAGDGQITTGNKMNQAAAELNGAAEKLNPNGRVDQALGHIEGGTRSVRTLMGPIATVLHSIAQGLSAFTIKTVAPVKHEVDVPPFPKITVVTGLSFSDTHPLRSIGDSVESVADNLDSIRDGLRDVADAALDLKNQLPEIKTKIVSGASDLDRAGETLVTAGNAMKDAGRLLAS